MSAARVLIRALMILAKEALGIFMDALEQVHHLDDTNIPGRGTEFVTAVQASNPLDHSRVTEGGHNFR